MQHLSFEIPSQQGLLDASGELQRFVGTNVIISFQMKSKAPAETGRDLHEVYLVTLAVLNGLEMGTFNPFEGF